MIDSSHLKDLLSKTEYSRLEKTLICLSVNDTKPKQVRDIKQLAVTAGLRAASQWNISEILRNAPSLAARTEDGWELTTDGRKQVAEIAGKFAASPIPIVASSLRKYLPNVTDSSTKEFLEEAIECYEAGHLRAAVVLTWVGAVSVLHTYVVDNKIVDFNNEAVRRDEKWRLAKNTDDLGRMKEADFLNVLHALSVIGKNVKQELENCLKLRNSCGHPNTLKIGDARVAAHIEILVLNVFAKFTA